ncbi:hypothetical protein BJY59DRAFT_165215 [Rhodotorula toruloides]
MDRLMMGMQATMRWKGRKRRESGYEDMRREGGWGYTWVVWTEAIETIRRRVVVFTTRREEHPSQGSARTSSSSCHRRRDVQSGRPGRRRTSRPTPGCRSWQSSAPSSRRSRATARSQAGRDPLCCRASTKPPAASRSGCATGTWPSRRWSRRYSTTAEASGTGQSPSWRAR